MSHFAVVREAGPAWTEGKGAFEQPAVADHAAFMSADDPWEMTGRLETVRVESWNVITGGQRLSSLQTGPRRTGQSKEER
jgi:hypothetical protein